MIIDNCNDFSIVFNKLNKKDRVKLCRELTNELNILPKNDMRRSIIYFIMKHLVFGGYIFIKDKYYFSSVNPKYNDKDFPLGSTYFKQIQETSSYLNNSSGKIYNKDYKKMK